MTTREMITPAELQARFDAAYPQYVIPLLFDPDVEMGERNWRVDSENISFRGEEMGELKRALTKMGLVSFAQTQRHAVKVV